MSKSVSDNGEDPSSTTVAEEDTTLPDFLALLQDDTSIASLLFSTKSNNGKKKDDASKHKALLLKTCQTLFQTVEGLSQTLAKVEESTLPKQESTSAHVASTSLSGLEELYLGTTTANDDDNEEVVDAETIWGQVDLQNDALHALLKKSVKRLGKAAEENAAAAGPTTTTTTKIQLLDLENQLFNGDDDEDEDDDNSDDDNEDEDDDNEEDDDEVARRMRERMERALDEMEEDEDEMEDDDENNNIDDNDSEDDDDEEEDTRFFGVKKNKQKKGKTANKSKPEPMKKEDEEEEDDNLIDPAAEELNNGFFDINEMEAFADEEEDMLPEQVWDPTPTSTKKDTKNTKSFHQRQREGMESDNAEDDDDDSDNDDDMLFDQNNSVKRKKYREDDEIEALYSMYKAPSSMDNDEDDDDDENDAVNMTAADLFGAPNKKYFHKWKAQQQKEHATTSSSKPAAKKKSANDDDDDDNDSWDAYNFDDDKAEWGASADDTDKAKAKKDGSDSESDSDDDDDSSSSEDSDSEEPKKQGKGEKKPAATKESSTKPKKPTSKSKQQQEKLREETERLEQELIQEKPWQMMGEAASGARPVNSLLEGTPEFKVASKIAPTITEEHTANLEDIIKGRIIAEDWDDIIPRELPDVAWHKKRGELPEVSQEKAKLGLGELYEREYLKKAVGYDADAAEKESEEEKAKNEMKQLFANICSKLDALSNYHFAPRPIADEADVKPATTPAIAMEEVLPLHVSDARAAAPEEVYGKKRGRDGILRNDAELEQTERKRIRSGKKAARRKARQQKDADNKLIARVQPGLGLNNPYEKRKANEGVAMARAEGRITEGKADSNVGYGSSNKFFKKLQDDVSKAVRDGKPTHVDTKEKSTGSRKSSSFKM